MKISVGICIYDLVTLTKADTEIGAEETFEEVEVVDFKEIRIENEQIIEVEANLEKNMSIESFPK